LRVPRRHVLARVVEAVRETHPGLERLVVAALCCAASRSFMAVVAPAGAGKSTAMRAVARSMPASRYYDSVTRAGLAALQRDLSGYRGVVVVDDLGKVETGYNRVSTLTTWAELCYTGYVEKHSYDVHVSLAGFRGSVLVGAQPVVLRSVIRSGEWEATIADKSVRYYHLIRPREPTSAQLALPELRLRDLDEVEEPSRDALASSGLLVYGRAQWSAARVREHASRLLRGMAALDGRVRVRDDDAEWARWAFAPLQLERVLFHKESFETGRDFNASALALLVELATHGRVTEDHLWQDYKVQGPVARAILQGLRAWWVEEEGGYVASDYAARVLRVVHPEWRGTNGRSLGTARAGRAQVRRS
jgi:hypothetical protein